MALVSILISNWHYIVLFPVIAFVISYLYTHRIPEVYAAKCQILLKSNETYDYQQKIYRGLGFGSSYANYEETASQMRVITSSNLLEEVMQKLPLNVSYYIIGRLKTTEVYKHMPFTVVYDERSFASSGMMFNLKILDSERFELNYTLDGASRTFEYEFGELILEDGLYLRVERQQNLNDVSVRALAQMNYAFSVYPNRALVSEYKSNIDVTNIPYTSIVEISLRDEIPQRAVEVLDSLANTYVTNTVRNQTDINENTLQYIDRQLEEVIRIINEIESELESFKEQKAILNLTKEEENYFQKMLDVETEINQGDKELEAIEDLTTYLLQNETVESILAPSIFVNYSDPQLTKQITDLYGLRTEYATLIESGTTNNPKVTLLLDRIQNLKLQILENLEIKRDFLTSSLKGLKEDFHFYESKIKDIPKTQRQVLNIERRLAVNEELYSFLLSKRAETIIAKAGLVPETKVIEKARSVGKVYPDKAKMNATNTLIGFGVAIVIILLKVLFFTKIGSMVQLQALTEIPILGSIPKLKSEEAGYQMSNITKHSDMVQAFRSLRTNLQFFSPEDSKGKVLVTSLMPGEGKTFTSVNLATILAHAQKRVLIIDFDLHKPRLAKALELENEVGVSNYLINQASVEEIIQKTPTPNLDVITSGPIPPNASELIMRPELKELLKNLEAKYDYIFFDTPPISLITDGILLMNEVDVKLFVLNSRSTSKTSIDYIERLIESKRFNNCALILNEEKMTRLKYYYSRYGYGGYGYGGYGYGAYGQHYGEGS